MQVCQGLHQLLFAGCALYAVVFSIVDKAICDRLPSQINAVQQKVRRSFLTLQCAVRR